MKKLLLLGSLLLSITIYSQNGYTIIIDGKEVFVKDDGSTVPVKASVAKPNVHALSGVHIVKKGENLYSISRLYGLTVDELCKINNIRKDTPLEIEQSLRVVGFTKPATNFTNASYHIVKKGDTLYNISKRYGITVAELKSLNGLTDNIIAINQRLRVN